MRSEDRENLKEGKSFRIDLPLMGWIIVIMALVVVVVGSAINYGDETALIHSQEGDIVNTTLAPEVAMWDQAAVYQQRADVTSPAVGAPPAAGRDMQTYLSRRAYPGAPPFIPHGIPEILDPTKGGELTCLACQTNGGYVGLFGAYAPITPHPQYTNCIQCHVPQQTTALFQGTNWVKVESAQMGQAALYGSPPAIPHSLQLRESCSTCHVGPGAVPEIATSHPERINCVQCHVTASNLAEWSR